MALTIAFAAGMTLLATPSLAESWPQRPVRLIVPVGVGTAADISARLYAERLSVRWKQPVVVENRPGADGLTGAAAFAAMHDDHVLLFSFAAPISVFPVLQETLPYAVGDFVPISMTSNVFVAVAVNASMKVNSLDDLVALARAQPGSLNYNASAGALPYVFAGFLKKAGLDMVSVFYQQLNLAYEDLAEGRLQVMLAAITGVRPLVQAGKVRVLAVVNKIRAPIVPETPTVAEAGYPDLSIESMVGLFGPRDMPPELRDRIAADVHAAAAEPELSKRLITVGQIAHSSTPAEFASAIAQQRDQMSSIVKLVGPGLVQ